MADSDSDSPSSPSLKRRRTEDNKEGNATAQSLSKEVMLSVKKVRILDVWTEFEISVIRLSEETYLLAWERNGAYLFPTYACDGSYAKYTPFVFSSIIFDANKANGNEHKSSESMFTDTWVGIFTAFTMSNTSAHLPNSFNIEEYRKAYVEYRQSKNK